MDECTDIFWIRNFDNLFCNFSFIPSDSVSLSENLNRATKLAIIIALILLIFFGPLIAGIFFLISIVAILVLFYGWVAPNETSPTNQTSVEGYNNSWIQTAISPVETGGGNPSNPPTTNSAQGMIIEKPSVFTWCDDAVPFPQDSGLPSSSYVSINQRLAGPPNPKTLIPPVVVPPSHDLEFWKANNLITHSAINDMRQIDNYNSGYYITPECNPGDQCMSKEVISPAILSRRGCDVDASAPIPSPSIPSEKASYVKRCGGEGGGKCEQQHPASWKTREGFSLGCGEKVEWCKKKPDTWKDSPTDGLLLTDCNYDPNLYTTDGLPVNYPGKVNEAQPDYNRRLFTQTIQPNVYTKYEVIEPLNSNIGISFTQQPEPTTVALTPRGDIEFTKHDPLNFTKQGQPWKAETVTESNVFDPRSYGYGSNNRAYVDDFLGQPKFYYDDVDAVRVPNYIVRSNIDFMPLADAYGPMQNQGGNPDTMIIRNLANKQFLDSTIQFRTGLQESMMDKANRMNWQNRMYPKRIF